MRHVALPPHVLRRNSESEKILKIEWLLLLAPLAALAQETQVNPTYVGSAVCRSCHPDIWADFYKNPHYRSVASGKEAPEKTGCEGCHGPGSAHVTARGGKTTIPHAFSL